MENYDEFFQRQISQMRSNANEKSPLTLSLRLSTIRFYGLPILSPLLNKEQKEELQKLRETASNIKSKKKISAESRVSHVQAILDSVQLRKAPTFDEFSGGTKPSSPLNPECQCILSISGDKDEPRKTSENHWNSSYLSPFAHQTSDEKVPIAANQPLTSTAYYSHACSSLIPFQREDSLQDSQITVHLEGVPLVRDRLEHDIELNKAYGFNPLLSYSNKHTHIDVSQQALSSGYVTNETSDVTATWVAETVNIKTGSMDIPRDAGELILNDSNLTIKTNDIINHAPVDGDVLEEKFMISDQACNDEAKPVSSPVEPDPAERPYRMSLQNLLKKSQEHRRRQRLLRNQTKSVKASEPGHVGEHSLSDKENEGMLTRETGKTEFRRTREKRMDQEEASLPAEDAQKESLVPCEVFCHDKNTEASKREVSRNITSPSKSLRSTPAKSALSNSPYTAGNPAWSASAAVSTSAKSFYQSKGKKTGSMLPRPCLTENKKFKNIPSPKFCLSPMRNKKSSALSSPVRKTQVRTSVCVNEEAGKMQGKCRSKGDTPLCRNTDQAEQIAQLELNLSSLKVLISDLESTLAESEIYPTNPTETANNSQPEQHESLSLHASDGTSPSVVPFSETVQRDELTKDYDIRPGNKQHEPPPPRVTSLVQKRRVPEVFRAINGVKQLSERTCVTTYANIQPVKRENASSEKKKGSEKVEVSLNSSSLNRSYDVDTPSGLWSQPGSQGKQLTPELRGQEGVSRVKRRLLMTTVDRTMSGQQADEDQPQTVTPKAVMQRSVQTEHEVQVRTLMEEQLKQQKLLQSLAVKYQFLRSLSFPCPGAGARLEDMATSSLCPASVSVGLDVSLHLPELTLAELSVLSDSLNVSQSRTSVPVCHRPLVAAIVKGYLTRRLLRTDRVAQLIRTIKDTQLFLQSFQPSTPGREYGSRQDRSLQKRVSLQLRSARYELHDLFFSASPAERMQVISWDREVARERELKRKENKEPEGRKKSSLSAATKKALERKRTMMLQSKAAEKTKPAVDTEEGWTFVPNPRRVPKKTTPLRRR